MESRGLGEAQQVADLGVPESQVAGEVAYLTGESSVTVTPPGAPASAQSGKYLVVLKRSGGKWLVSDAIHNADGPCPQGAR